MEAFNTFNGMFYGLSSVTILLYVALVRLKKMKQ